MSAISSWLLSIAGVVVLSVLSEFVLPDGQMNKFVKVVFSFVILLVIVFPLPSIFGKEFDFSKFLEADTNLQDEYLEQINLDKLTLMSKDLNTKVLDAGIENVEITINANIFSKTLQIYGVNADIRNMKASVDKSTAKSMIIEIIKGFGDLSQVEVKFNE